MKKLLLIAITAFVAAAMVTSCNKKLGPEEKTPPVIHSVTFTPTEVAPDEKVHVSADVTSEYGFKGIGIIYQLNDDQSTQKEITNQIWYSTDNETSKKYTATLDGQPAGTKVTFFIYAVSAYGLLAVSTGTEYTVTGTPESGDPTVDEN